MRRVRIFGSTAGTEGNLFLGALLVAPILAAIAFYIIQRQAIITTDSPEYLHWAPIRTSVYPLFLLIVRGPFVLPLQLLLFALSVSWLVQYVYRFYGNILLVALLCAVLIFNPYLWKLQASVVSEAITTPLLVILLGSLAGYLAKQRASAALLASVTAGVLAAGRPSNLPLVVIPSIAVLLASGSPKQGKVKLACLCFAAALALVAGDKLLTRAVHGSETRTLLGMHTFAKSVLVDAPPLPVSSNPVDRRVADLAERQFEPIRSVLHSASGQPDILNILSMGYEACVERACTDKALADLSIPPEKLDEALFRVGLARLKENPGGYLDLSLREYQTIWLLNPRKDPVLARELNAYLSKAAPLPQQELIAAGWFDPVGPQEPSRLGGLLRSLFIVLGIFAAALTVLLGWLQFRGKVQPMLTTAFVSLLSVQLVLIFCSLVGMGIPRYTMGMWPMIAGALALVAVAIFDYGRARQNLKSVASVSGS